MTTNVIVSAFVRLEPQCGQLPVTAHVLAVAVRGGGNKMLEGELAGFGKTEGSSGSRSISFLSEVFVLANMYV